MKLRLASACLCPIAFTTLAPCAAQAPAKRVHVVQQIFRDGKPVASASGVKVTQPGGTLEKAIRLKETILDGTRIDVPPRIVVIVVSTGAKSSVTLEPGSSVTFISTGPGELVSSDAGKAIFSVVPKSLDFFRVQSGEAITAGVHGTVFSLERSPSTVTVTCTRGAVDITKTGYLQIGEETTKVSLIDTISAGHPETIYH